MTMGKSKQSAQGSGSVWGEQAGYLGDLFSQGSEMLSGITNQNNQVQQGVQGAYQNMIQPQGNPYLNQIGQQGLDLLNNQFDRNLNQIQGNSVMAGNLGSSRQGVAEGMAYEQNTQQSSDFISNLFGNQYQADQNRAASLIPYGNQVGTGGFAPLQGLKSIIGGPTVLNNSSSNGSSFSFGL